MTTNLHLLFNEFDSLEIPYSSRGGQLFIKDNLHTQFILGLRAIADKDDGTALAALLRPPFFAVDLNDLALFRSMNGENKALQSACGVEDFIRDLRARRHERLPGETARELLESTSIGRVTALGPNGAQRLERLRELCLILENKAVSEGLDYDQTTAKIRGWIDKPPQLDPPHPVGKNAVQVMTVFQAKGLEFPVVIIWDSQAGMGSKQSGGSWLITRDAKKWAIDIDYLEWEEPQGSTLKKNEKAFFDEERRRQVYVQATRARDLLVIPSSSRKGRGGKIYSELVGDLEKKSDLVLAVPGFLESKPPDWAKKIKEPVKPVPVFDDKLYGSINKRWIEGLGKSARPFYQPVSVVSMSVEAAASLPKIYGFNDMPRKSREGRFGPVFGKTVHLAIVRVIDGKAKDALEALEWARKETGLAENVAEAGKDVEQALISLKNEGLLAKDIESQLEYPVAGPEGEEKIVSGLIDFIGIKGDCANIIDFKTDHPPEGGPQNLQPQYREQVKKYREIVGKGSLSGIKNIKCGLLFTASGQLIWVE